MLLFFINFHCLSYSCHHGDIIPRIFEIVEKISWKKRRCSTLLLHSAAQLTELRTCRSVENVTSPISKCRPSADLSASSSSSVSISFYFTSIGDIARVTLEETSSMSKRKWTMRLIIIVITTISWKYRIIVQLIS